MVCWRIQISLLWISTHRLHGRLIAIRLLLGWARGRLARVSYRLHAWLRWLLHALILSIWSLKIKSIWKQNEFLERETSKLGGSKNFDGQRLVEYYWLEILFLFWTKTRSFRFWRKLKCEVYLIGNGESCYTYAWGLLWRRRAMAWSGSLWQSSKKPLHKLNNFQMIKNAVWFTIVR